MIKINFNSNPCKQKTPIFKHIQLNMYHTFIENYLELKFPSDLLSKSIIVTEVINYLS